jgi:hypothetical protein
MKRWLSMMLMLSAAGAAAAVLTLGRQRPAFTNLAARGAPVFGLTAGGGGGGGGGGHDIVVDMEAGANGNIIGRPLLTNMTSTGIGLGSSVGAWLVFSNSASVTGSTRFVISTEFAARGTRSARIDANVDNVYAEFMPATSNAVMSYGFALRHGGGFSGSTFGSYNWFEVHYSGGTEYTVYNQFDAEPHEFDVQTGAGLTGDPLLIGSVELTNAWLWVTMKWDRTTPTALCNIYNYAGSGTLGTLRKAITATLTAQYPQRWVFGRPDNHDVFNNGFVYIDDVCVDYEGTFPLLPP